MWLLDSPITLLHIDFAVRVGYGYGVFCCSALQMGKVSRHCLFRFWMFTPGSWRFPGFAGGGSQDNASVDVWNIAGFNRDGPDPKETFRGSLGLRSFRSYPARTIHWTEVAIRKGIFILRSRSAVLGCSCDFLLPKTLERASVRKSAAQFSPPPIFSLSLAACGLYAAAGKDCLGEPAPSNPSVHFLPNTLSDFLAVDMQARSAGRIPHRSV